MAIWIEVDEKQLEAAREALSHIPGAVERAAARAINRAVVAANRAASQQLQGQYVIRDNVIRQYKKITKKAKVKSLFARIESEGRTLPLSSFKINPKRVSKRRPRKALLAQVKQSGGGAIRGAFVTGVETGHIGVKHIDVFIRKNGNASLPIKKLYGPSIPQMLGNKFVTPFVNEKAQEVLAERFEHEVQAILGGFVN